MATKKKARASKPATKAGRSGFGRPPAKQAAARLEAILAAAAEIFLKEGFDRASVGSIARQAGASTETLYSRFPTKEQLFEAVISRKTDILLQKFSQLLVREQPIEKVLMKYGSNLLDFMLLPEMQNLNRTLISAAPQFPKLAGRFWQLCPEREEDQLAQYLEIQIKSGVLVPFNTKKISELFFSLCLGQYLLHAQMFVRTLPDPAERKKHIRAVVSMFLAAYATRTA